MVRKWNIASTIIIIGFTIMILVNMGFNIFGKVGKFWQNSFLDIMQLLILLVVSFSLVQMQNRINRKIEKLDVIIDKIQEKLLDEKLIRIGNENECLKTRIKLLSISNLLEYIKKYDKKIDNEMNSIIEQMDMLNMLVFDHIEDKDFIKKSEPRIQFLIYNMVDKLDGIHLKLG